MKREQVTERIQELFRDVFDDQSLVIHESMSSSNLATWDSLHHISLLVAIQNEFQIKFSLIEIQDLQNIGSIIDLILQHVNAE
ncbi:acyl carrier protein [Legionella shakespearei]|uniref:Acyl carrier protein n=1 Tax=Legionella shakespearei DSM 23087 TaxID=1122169 RepID=A0A0W0YUZ2_9GAMM|nr:acyl carrier protein [Legionella shakespearei]KTD60701.1 Acyl carrier protein [Legionella shakespearei DSM 23087]